MTILPRRLNPDSFTLVEMLVVVAVIAILAALAFPSLSMALRKRDQTVCASNLRSLGQAFLLYSGDHDNTLPPPVNVASQPTLYWRKAVLAYGGTTNVYETTYICPPIQRLVVKNGGTSGIPSYAMNQFLVGASSTQGIRISAIRRPSTTILATEASLGPAFNDSVPYEALSPSILMRPGNVHQGANNLLFVDGSVMLWKDAMRLIVAPYVLGGAQDMWTP